MERSDSNDEILNEIRMKYAEDLEEILECPVCYEIPKGIITMCRQGHHICSICRELLITRGDKCPICQNSFSICRNYAAEKLCCKFEDIRSSILDPKHGSNRRAIKNVASVLVQTDCDNVNKVYVTTCTVATQTKVDCSLLMNIKHEFVKTVTKDVLSVLVQTDFNDNDKSYVTTCSVETQTNDVGDITAVPNNGECLEINED